jgi:hypothetical protein
MIGIYSHEMNISLLVLQELILIEIIEMIHFCLMKSRIIASFDIFIRKKKKNLHSGLGKALKFCS